MCDPIKICKHIFISHNLFVDDVLLFAMLSRASWICLKNILERFQKASGLIINKAKSFLYHNDSNRDMIIWISQRFGIESRSLKDGIKYLGFHLKAKAYSRNDWRWLTDRFFKKISMWEHRSLSLGGRVVLTQSVLMQLAVYWAHLFILPASIIHSMNRISANFIWGANADRGKIHLSKMDSISMPKKLEGWGLMDQRLFEKALVCKSMWRGIFGDNPWSAIIHQKYLKGRSLEHWFRFGSIGIKQGSAIWHSFRKNGKYFLKNLKWRMYSGRNIFISIDSFAGYRWILPVPDPLLFVLHRMGLFTWDKIIADWRGFVPILKDAVDIGLPVALLSSWANVKDALGEGGIKRAEPKDHLVWSLSHSHSTANVKDIYYDLVSKKIPPARQIFLMVLWKLGCPLKVTIFSWLVFYNKNLTWENLRKRWWHGPSRCVMRRRQTFTCSSNAWPPNKSSMIWLFLFIFLTWVSFLSMQRSSGGVGKRNLSVQSFPLRYGVSGNGEISRFLKTQNSLSSLFC